MDVGQDQVRCVSAGEADRRFGSGPRLTIEAEPGAIRLTGTVDASNAGILREWLLLQPDGSDLVLDIQHLSFRDESGFRVLEEMVRAAGRSRKVILTGSAVSGSAKKVRSILVPQHPRGDRDAAEAR